MSIIRGKDSKNVRRGSCINHADCNEYEWIVANGTNCCYCGCLPIEHDKLDENKTILQIDPQNFQFSQTTCHLSPSELLMLKESLQNGPSEPSYNQENFINSPKDQDSQETVGSSTSPQTTKAPEKADEPKNSNFTENQHNCIQCEQNVTLDYLIPDKYPTALLNAINSGNIDLNQQSHIIRIVVSNMIQHDKTTSIHALEIGVALVKKYPSFKGEFGTDYVGVVKAVKDCIKRQKQAKKTSKGDIRNKDWLKEQTELMLREVRKGKERSLEILKKTLQQTREARTKDAKTLTAKEMLTKYAALGLPEMLIWDFSDTYGIPVTTLRRNWLDALPKILTILPSTSLTDVNLQTMYVILNLADAFNIKKDLQKPLLIILKPGTPLGKTVPEKDEPPRLTAVGDVNDKKLKLFCFVDGVAMFSEPPVEALLKLISSYWIFNIKFDPIQKQILLFLSGCLFRKKSSDLLKQTLAKALSVTKLLKKAGIS